MKAAAEGEGGRNRWIGRIDRWRVEGGVQSPDTGDAAAAAAVTSPPSYHGNPACHQPVAFYPFSVILPLQRPDLPRWPEKCKRRSAHVFVSDRAVLMLGYGGRWHSTTWNMCKGPKQTHWMFESRISSLRSFSYINNYVQYSVRELKVDLIVILLSNRLLLKHKSLGVSHFTAKNWKVINVMDLIYVTVIKKQKRKADKVVLVCDCLCGWNHQRPSSQPLTRY